MKHLFTICLFLLFCNLIFGQYHPFIDAEKFSDEPIEIPEEFKDKNEITLFKHRKVSIVNTDKAVEQYFRLHEKILVNSDDAIEKNNRIYISISEGEEILVNKNRVILPSGETIELSSDDIHVEEDSESGSSYQYYAVKGLEIGAIIEKIYITQEQPYFRGSKFNFQGSSPILESKFQVLYPKHLEFKYKSYNGLEEATYTDSISENQQMLEVISKNLPAANFDEKSANPKKHIKAFRYKLFKNKASGAKNFYNYNEFATEFYEGISGEPTKKEKKAITKFLKPIDATKSEAEKLLDLECLIKENIAYNRSFRENYSLADIFKTKQANLRTLMELYVACFNELDINGEFVFTCDRFDYYFDPEFETTDNLQEVLFYFPNLDQYLQPVNVSFRTPLINYGNADNDGLRIKIKSFGGVDAAVAEKVFIPIPGMEISSDTMRIDVDMSEDVSEPMVESNMVFGGYSGANLQPIKDFVPADQYEDILKDICENYAADVEMDVMQAINDGQEFLGREKFGLHLEFNASDLMQKTGPKYLFELGKLIGKQSELYQEDERQFPIEISYPHDYYRTLNVKLPEGYQVANPEVLQMDYKAEFDGEIQALFTSEYSVEGNLLTIQNFEYYRIVKFPLEHFEAYQKVLNAAADFNKIVLVLEKK